MTALTFGSSEAPLFGVFHPSTASKRPKRAVLLCNPFGEEAIRAFRPFKRLAEMLADEGIPTLRFDYLGSGDSAGDDDEVSLATMTQSLLEAHEELKDLSEVREIYWVALRFGAWAALDAAGTARPAGLILWEPITDGPAYADELRDLPGAADEALGFPVPSALWDALSSELPSRPEGVAIKLVGHEGISGLDQIVPPEFEEWNSDDALNSFTMPIGTLNRIRQEIAEW